MSTVQGDAEKLNGTNAVNGHDHANGAATQRKPYDYGGNPLAHVHTNSADSVRLAAFGGELQPGLYKVDPSRKIANPVSYSLAVEAIGWCGNVVIFDM